MDLRAAIYEAAKTAGLDTALICWTLNSGASEEGFYTISDLAQAVDYNASVPESARVTQAQVLAAWQALALGGVNAGGIVASDVLVTGELLGDVMTATVSPASGSYPWALWVDGLQVNSSAGAGEIDAADGYALAIACGAAGIYVLRVVASNGDTAQLSWEVQ